MGLGNSCLFFLLFRLDMEYIDLYLIHAPKGGKNLETYEAMQGLVKQGLVRFVYFVLVITVILTIFPFFPFSTMCF